MGWAGLCSEHAAYKETLSPRGRMLGRNWDKSLKSFIHSHLTIYPPPIKSGLKLVNIVCGNLQSEDSQDMSRNLNEKSVCSWIQLQLLVDGVGNSSQLNSPCQSSRYGMLFAASIIVYFIHLEIRNIVPIIPLNLLWLWTIHCTTVV